MTNYLIGSQGRLGQAIFSDFANDDIVCLERSVYKDWSLSASVNQISKYFESHTNETSTVIVASGLLDPTLATDDLLSVNYMLPKNVIDGATKLGIRVITFGTVMEELMPSKNAYVQSKTFLNEHVRAMADKNNSVVHVQLHTLYGGKDQPSPFMFLGRILSALENNTVFKMTSGRQLREYHHLLDEVKAIREIADKQSSGVMNLSHSKPVTLKSVAQNVFSAFEKDHLLQIGALPEPPDENYDKTFQQTGVTMQIDFRDSLPAIIDYMKSCYVYKAPT